jgi:YbbR domain-containing protein
LNTKKIILGLAENWPAKVLSVALAIMLFVFNQMSTLTTRTLSVPLTVETGFTLVPGSAYPRTVRVRLRGEDETIKLITDSDIEAYVDFSRYEAEGLYSAPVQIRRKGSALAIEPLEITVNPLEISVNLDRRVNKALLLYAVIRGNPAPGFDLISHSISPGEIVVSGPSGRLESITEIKTEAIDIEGRNSDFSITVNIVNPDPLFIIRGESTAEFSCLIKPLFPERE